MWRMQFLEIWLLGAALGLGGCAQEGASRAESGAQPSGAQAAILAPWMTIQGGWLATQTDATGFVRQRGPFLPLRYPSAVALGGNDVVIADAGANRVYRYDLTQQTLAVVPGVSATQATRVAIGRDLSAYVLDPGARRIVRVGRDGRVLQTLANEQVLARPTDFALRETSGEILFADATLGQIVTLRLATQAAFAATPRGEQDLRAGQIAAIASGAGRVCFSDPAARAVRCIAPDGTQLEALRDESLRMPGPLAIDRFGRVIVSDVAAGGVRIFDGGRLVASIGPAELGVAQITGIATDANFVAIADGPGAKVALFSLRPPSR